MHLDDLAGSAALGLGMLGLLNVIKRKWRAAYK
jgi:hypothetical protein